jgi:hypothetical protein
MDARARGVARELGKGGEGSFKSFKSPRRPAISARIETIMRHCIVFLNVNKCRSEYKTPPTSTILKPRAKSCFRGKVFSALTSDGATTVAFVEGRETEEEV